jgi:sensor histidine kinase regulating citrate/malate metabolism
LSGEVFFVGQENILESEIYKYSSSVTAPDSNTVGTLSVGFYKDYYYSQARKSFNVVLKNVLFAAIGSIILSVFAVFFISKWFAKSFEDSEKRFKDDFLVSGSHEF